MCRTSRPVFPLLKTSSVLRSSCKQQSQTRQKLEEGSLDKPAPHAHKYLATPASAGSFDPLQTTLFRRNRPLYLKKMLTSSFGLAASWSAKMCLYLSCKGIWVTVEWKRKTIPFIYPVLAKEELIYFDFKLFWSFISGIKVFYICLMSFVFMF